MLYPVYVHMGDEEQAHSVIIPDFPVCLSAADDWDGLAKAVQEAIERYCDDENAPLPQPSSLAELQARGEYEGGTWVLVDVNVSRLQGPARRINLTVPKGALRAIDGAAAAHGESRSAYLTRAGVQDARIREQHEAVAHRERLLAESQRIARIGSWRLDAATSGLEWSAETYRIVGVSPPAFTPTPEAFLEHVHPDDPRRLLDVRDPALAGDGQHDLEFRIRRPDGIERIVHEIATVERDAGGAIIALAGTIQDVTRRRLAERRNKQYRRLLEASQDLFCIIDGAHRYVMMTAAYASAHGLDRQRAEGADLRGQLGAELVERQIVPPLQRCLAGEEQRFEAERVHADGDRRQLLIHYFPIPDPGTGERLAGVSITDITAFRRAEAERDNQARLLTIAGRVARLGGWWVDLRTGRVTWSDMVAEIHGMPHGYSPTVEEGIGIYAPEYRERIQSLFRACSEAGEPYDEELQIIDAAGRHLWVRALGEPVHDHGTITAVQGAFQDVTDRHEDEQQLRKLASIIDQSPAAVAVTDLEGHIEYVNPAFERVSGYSRAELLGDTPARLNSGNNPDAVYRELWETITAGRVWTGLLQNRRKDGTLYWEDEVVAPLTDERGEVINYFAIKQDITELKRAEAELREQQVHLLRNRDELAALLRTRQALINALPANIALLDAQGNVLEVNEQWRIFGEASGNRDPDVGGRRELLGDLRRGRGRLRRRCGARRGGRAGRAGWPANGLFA